MNKAMLISFFLLFLCSFAYAEEIVEIKCDCGHICRTIGNPDLTIKGKVKLKIKIDLNKCNKTATGLEILVPLKFTEDKGDGDYKP